MSYPLYPALAPLIERGISARTLDHFGVVPHTGRAGRAGPNSPRARYPILTDDGCVAGYKSKALAAGTPGRYKNLWEPGHDDDAGHWLYAARDVAGITAGQPVILTEGEPDLWLLHTLGIAACTTTRGATAGLSCRAIARITGAAPSIVLVIYDVNDGSDAGRRGGIAATRALRDAGLRANALALPASLPSGGDLTDLFHVVKRDRAAFIAAIKACPALDIPAPAPPPASRPMRRVSGNGDAPPWERFNATHDIVDIAERLAPVRRVGGRAVTRCPFHDDHSPSLTLYEQQGRYYCFSCGAWGSTYDLAKKAGAA